MLYNKITKLTFIFGNKNLILNIKYSNKYKELKNSNKGLDLEIEGLLFEKR